MRSEPTNSCWSNDSNTLLISSLDDLPGVSFWDSLSNDGDGVNLEDKQ